MNLLVIEGIYFWPWCWDSVKVRGERGDTESVPGGAV